MKSSNMQAFFDFLTPTHPHCTQLAYSGVLLRCEVTKAALEAHMPPATPAAAPWSWVIHDLFRQRSLAADQEDQEDPANAREQKLGRSPIASRFSTSPVPSNPTRLQAWC